MLFGTPMPFLRLLSVDLQSSKTANIDDIQQYDQLSKAPSVPIS